MKSIFLLCVVLAVANGQSRVINWLAAGQGLAKGKINAAADIASATLGFGNTAAQMANDVATSVVDKGIGAGRYGLNIGTGLTSSALATGTNAANTVLDTADAVFGRVPFVSLGLGLGKFGVSTLNNVGQAAISTVDTVGNAKLSLANTAAHLGTGAIKGAAAAGTAIGQAAAMGGASVGKTVVDNIFRLGAQVISGGATSNSTDLADIEAPLYSGWGLLFNKNSYEAITNASPYIMKTVMDLFRN